MTRERIQKVMAAAGIASRRGSEDFIRAGRVTVDGRAAVLGEQVDPDMQKVLVDGKPLKVVTGPHAYWALNKPAGVVSTTHDRHAERTVMDFLPPAATGGRRLYPVGRLDGESEGLLLFTDDGAWADLLLHPRYGVEREYLVGLNRSLTKIQKTALREGVELEEGVARVDHLADATAAQIRTMLLLLDPPESDLRWYRVILAQGWKRQIRRMFEVVEAPVRRLVRIRVGTFKLTNLKSGEARELRYGEMAQLAACARTDGGIRPIHDAAGPSARD